MQRVKSGLKTPFDAGIANASRVCPNLCQYEKVSLIVDKGSKKRVLFALSELKFGIHTTYILCTYRKRRKWSCHSVSYQEGGLCGKVVNSGWGFIV